VKIQYDPHQNFHYPSKLEQHRVKTKLKLGGTGSCKAYASTFFWG